MNNKITETRRFGSLHFVDRRWWSRAFFG